ncbi:Kelch-like protein 6 [Symbiodinium microadriaticum]|uniref:Kelch-like protein 6 n=1 Tax=Symbiodinium microadriaticum TaxID=2951 RepID=A0A1Q9E7N3_SYMMI|nr:Kelch-like protein 6 [Symbiodinium microadriaticum]CAE7885894.1 KLHL6 [Symbiodinium sp. KB8]
MTDASTSDGVRDAVFSLIRVADLQGLQSITPGDFDWSVPGDRLKRLPLIEAMVTGNANRTQAELTTRAEMIRWMLKAGANPLQGCPSNEETYGIWKVNDKDKTMIRISYSRSAISFACELMGAMKKAAQEGTDWSSQIAAFQIFLEALTRGAATRNNVSVPQGVVDMWESIREMTSTHNVIFETADEEVSAHDLVLVAASPVLKAMLESTMKEGSSKRISVKDSSGSGARLFVDMLYTSSTRDDPDYKTVLVALDLAHRWQVDRIVPVLAGMLPEMLTVDSFVAIAEAAMLKGLESLQRACRTFATNNSEINAMLEKGTLPAEVRKLLGESEAPAAEQGQRKKRRIFTET